MLLQTGPIGLGGIIDREDDHPAVGSQFVVIRSLGIRETEDGGAAEIGLVGILIQRGKELGTPVIRRKIHYRQMQVAVYRRQDNGEGRHNGRHPSVLLGGAEFLEGCKGYHRQHQQRHVFPKTLGVGKVDRLAETTAVHGRILNPERQC